MKILLTGGSGFIGRNIQESFLAKKYRILAPRSRDLDLTDEKSTKAFFKNRSFDAVIHGAGKPGHRNAADPTNIFYTDMRMFMNLLQYRRQLGKIIVLSSGAIYDQRQSIAKAKEDDYRLKVPADEHALYRRIAAEIIEHLNNAVELRIFGIFGKHEDYAIRFISNAICKTLYNLPITIKQNRKFDYLYIDDLMPVLDYFIKNTVKHKAYNLTPEKSIELLALAKIVLEISGKNLPINILQEGLGLEYSGSNLRLKKEMPEVSFSPVKKSLSELFNWYTERKNSIDRQILLVDK